MELSTQFVILVPIIIGLVQVIKPFVSDRFAPLAAIALGIAGAYLIGGALSQVVLEGIVAGLSAIGLFSGTRATFRS